MSFWASKALLSAVELGVFTTLAKGPQPFEALRATLELHPRSARDFLDTLVSMGFLERTSDSYANSPDADVFLDKGKPSYIGGILEMANSRLFHHWGNLTEALRTGKPQNEMKSGGTDVFETLYDDPDRLKEFLGAMTGTSRLANQAIASRFPWSEYRTFADIGTAQGDLAVQIALANPHVRGAGFDLPKVAPIFNEYVQRNKVSDRLRFHPGDFFNDEFPSADVILMGHILHDWDLPTKEMLLRKAFDALPSGGAVVVFESIIDDERRENTFGLLMSLNMLIETPGGFDFTARDCAAWMTKAGFRSMRTEHLAGPNSMVVGIK